MKKITLTSIVAITFVLPAFAEGFPGNGYMLENKTYDGAATYTNMGVYSDSVNATADYSDNTYNVVAGTYLPAASETVTQCPANSFCPGLTGPTYYDANNAQGATACSTLTGGYNSSDAGASTDTDCYKACTTSNVAHSTAVSGNDYYGAGVDTCEATGCDSGYHVKDGFNLQTIIGTEASGVTAFVNVYGMSGGNLSEYGLTTSDSNVFVVDYGNRGVIRGLGRCNNQSGSMDNPVTTLSNNDGKYCYCQLTGYTPSSGSSRSLTTPFVFRFEYADENACGVSCSGACAAAIGSTDTSVFDSLAYRAAILGTVPVELATCAANTITINWSDVDGVNGTHTTDVSYDGDITTPVKAAVKPGKTFVGWKFVKPGS